MAHSEMISELIFIPSPVEFLIADRRHPSVGVPLEAERRKTLSEDRLWYSNRCTAI